MSARLPRAPTTLPQAPVLLLSDLHLPPRPSAYRQAFARFLAGPARSAAAVYILGDLFDAWIGDDAGLEDYAAECEHLAALTGSGVAVHFLHGNRDFLIGPAFASRTGVRLLPESLQVDLPSGPALLLHGDTLCVDDVAFQRFRSWTHRRVLQRAFLRLPLRWRRRITRRLQQASHSAKGGKSGPLMDVNPDAVREAMQRCGVACMIHGHTHRPGRYMLTTIDGVLERIVLPDWRPGHMGYVVSDAHGLHTAALQ